MLLLYMSLWHDSIAEMTPENAAIIDVIMIDVIMIPVMAALTVGPAYASSPYQSSPVAGPYQSSPLKGPYQSSPAGGTLERLAILRWRRLAAYWRVRQAHPWRRFWTLSPRDWPFYIGGGFGHYPSERIKLSLSPA